MAVLIALNKDMLQTLRLLALGRVQQKMCQAING